MFAHVFTVQLLCGNETGTTGTVVYRAAKALYINELQNLSFYLAKPMV